MILLQTVRLFVYWETPVHLNISVSTLFEKLQLLFCITTTINKTLVTWTPLKQALSLTRY